MYLVHQNLSSAPKGFHHTQDSVSSLVKCGLLFGFSTEESWVSRFECDSSDTLFLFYTSARGNKSKTFHNVPSGQNLETDSWELDWEVQGNEFWWSDTNRLYFHCVSKALLQHGLAWDGEGRATANLLGPGAACKKNHCLLLKWLSWTLFTMMSAKPFCWISNSARGHTPVRVGEKNDSSLAVFTTIRSHLLQLCLGPVSSGLLPAKQWITSSTTFQRLCAK